MQTALWLVLLFILQPSAFSLAQTWISDTVSDSYGRAVVTNVLITPLSTPRSYSGRTLISAPTNVTTDASGYYEVSLYPGAYSLRYGSNTGRDSFTILVPTNSLTNAVSILKTSAEPRLLSVVPAYELRSLRGVANGYANLDGDGLIPYDQMPPQSLEVSRAEMLAISNRAGGWINANAAWGITGDGSTDNTAAMLTMRGWLRSNDNARIVFTNGTYHYATALWLAGVKNVEVDGGNASFVNVTSVVYHFWHSCALVINPDFFFNWTTSVVQDARFTGDGWPNQTEETPNLINTVESGATNLTLITATATNKFASNDWALVYGWTGGGGIYPPGAYFYEMVRIHSFAAGGVLNFKGPLRNRYDARWFGVQGSSHGAPAAILPLNRPTFQMAEKIVLRNMKFRGWPAGVGDTGTDHLGQGVLYACSANEILIENCEMGNFTPTECGLVTIRNSKIGYTEPDKLLDTMIFEKCDIEYFGSCAGINFMQMRDCIIRVLLVVNGRNNLLENCDIMSGLPYYQVQTSDGGSVNNVSLNNCRFWQDSLASTPLINCGGVRSFFVDSSSSPTNCLVTEILTNQWNQTIYPGKKLTQVGGTNTGVVLNMITNGSSTNYIIEASFGRQPSAGEEYKFSCVKEVSCANYTLAKGASAVPILTIWPYAEKITFTPDPTLTLGIVGEIATNAALALGSSSAWTMDGTTNFTTHQVGIGVTSPSRLLGLKSDNGNTYMSFNGGTANSVTMGSDITGRWVVYDDSNYAYRLVLSNEFFGIGTGLSMPRYTLDTKGTNNTEGAIFLNGSSITNQISAQIAAEAPSVGGGITLATVTNTPALALLGNLGVTSNLNAGTVSAGGTNLHTLAAQGGSGITLATVTNTPALALLGNLGVTSNLNAGSVSAGGTNLHTLAAQGGSGISLASVTNATNLGFAGHVGVASNLNVGKVVSVGGTNLWTTLVANDTTTSNGVVNFAGTMTGLTNSNWSIYFVGSTVVFSNLNQNTGWTFDGSGLESASQAYGVSRLVTGTMSTNIASGVTNHPAIALLGNLGVTSNLNAGSVSAGGTNLHTLAAQGGSGISLASVTNATNLGFAGDIGVATNLNVGGSVSVGGTNLHTLAAQGGSGITLASVTNQPALAFLGNVGVTSNLNAGSVSAGGTNLHTLASSATGGGSTQMVAAAVGDVLITNRLVLGTNNSLPNTTTNVELIVAFPLPAQRALWIGSNNTQTATLIVTNGRVGIGKNNPAYALEVVGASKITGDLTLTGGSIIASSSASVGQSEVYGWLNRTRMSSPVDKYIALSGFDWQVGEFSGIVLGTNSIAAPNSGPTNAAPLILKARTFGASHVPGIKLDSNGSTNGCFLEMRALPGAYTNVVPGSGCIILFACTNGTADGKAAGYAESENGTITQITPHASDAPAEFYIVTNWLHGMEPKISKSENIYTGIFEWQNESLKALIAEWLADGQDISKLGLKGAIHRIETYAEYTARTGMAKATRDWDRDQNELQARYDAERAEQVAAKAKAVADKALDPKVSDDVYIKPAQDIRKPKSTFMLETR